MKKWHLPPFMLRPVIPFRIIRRRIKRQVDLLQTSKLFDVDYYISQAQKVGISVSPHRAVWHYITVGDKIRLKPHPLFDTHYYHDIYRDIEQSGVSALYHFMTHGAKENRSPHPAFDTAYVKSQIATDQNPLISYLHAEPGTVNPHRMFQESYVLNQIAVMYSNGRTTLENYFEADLSVEPSKHFNAEHYLRRYPDIADIHPFYHYLRYGIKEGRIVTGSYNSIDNIKADVMYMDQFDPDVLPPWLEIDEIGKLSRVLIETSEEIALRKLLKAAEETNKIYVLIANNLTIGGAEKVLANVNNSFIECDKISNVLIVVTSHGPRDALKWFRGSKYRVVDVSEEFDRMSEHSSALLLANFLQLLEVQGLLVINSRQGWALAERHGRALSQRHPVSVACFCYDYDRYGRRAGYARTHLPHAFAAVTNVITDNVNFKATLTKDLRLGGQESIKIKVLYQPIEIRNLEQPSLMLSTKLGKRKVLWAGRFSLQKRVSLALEIAQLMPQVQFVFAGGELSDIGLPLAALGENVTIFGSYHDLDDLGIRQFDAFLYTSKWDGLPNVLLEVAANGLPIVAPNVGGISELVNFETGWLVDDHDNASAYVLKLREIFNKPKEVNIRLIKMRDHIRRQHGQNVFDKAVADALIQE